MRWVSHRIRKPNGAVPNRGIALLLVLISFSVLTVVATEFAYNARVDLQMAANQRDEIRAYYLARSSIGLSRLMLKFQRQLDQVQLPNLGGLLAQLTGGQAPAGGQAPQGGGGLSIQLWRMAKIDCHMLQMMVTDDGKRKDEPESKLDLDPDESPEVALKVARRSFGGFEGCFRSELSDEEERINLSKFDAPQTVSRIIVDRTLELLSDKRFEFLFEDEDDNKVKATPQEVVTAIRDWIDEDESQSAYTPVQGEPFARGFSDENYSYDRFTPRYKSKNARFDSLDELYMVHGVNDKFMAAFKDRFTVYPDVNARLNVNTDDPVLMYVAILSVADPLRPDPRLRDPVFIDTLIQKIRAARVFSLFGLSVIDFVNIVESAGVAVNTSIKNNVRLNRAVGDKSATYRIKAIGEAGSVTKTITAVVRLDDGLGRLVYWREE